MRLGNEYIYINLEYDHNNLNCDTAVNVFFCFNNVLQA